MTARRAALVGFALLACGCVGSPESHVTRPSRPGVDVAAPHALGRDGDPDDLSAVRP